MARVRNIKNNIMRRGSHNNANDFNFNSSKALDVAANKIYHSTKKISNFEPERVSLPNKGLSDSYGMLPRTNNSTLENYNSARPSAGGNQFVGRSTMQPHDVRRKKIMHFSNRNVQYLPKTALNHAHVCLDGDMDGESDDDVPDENVDERSVSRVRNRILSRDSLTGKWNMQRTTNSSTNLSFQALNRSHGDLTGLR